MITLAVALALLAGSDEITITRSNSQSARVGASENFTGVARIDSAFPTRPPSRMYGARVSFEAGARTAWHTHPVAQLLIVTAGTGRVQKWGGAIEEIHTGDVVSIPAGVKHWHGAAPSRAMTHFAITEELDGKGVDWMEKVSDAQYGTVAVVAAKPSQQAIGSIAPKLAELTDEVLYADVWERPELGKRDRSLVTVAALIAMNRPEQLRSHLQRARDNGVTQAEVIETITHLAFYAGWPNAVSALAVARDVFEKK